MLKDHKIPILLFSQSFYPDLEKITGSGRVELERAGLVDWTTSFGAKNIPLPSPHWRAHATYYWEQTFPAGKTVEVSHSYTPVPGISFYGEHVTGDAGLKNTYCIDKDFARSAKRLMAKHPDGLMRELHYILTSASNLWCGYLPL